MRGIYLKSLSYPYTFGSFIFLGTPLTKKRKPHQFDGAFLPDILTL